MEVNNKIKVLFVCAGNICRSPLAEGVFSHYITQQKIADHFEIDSAGTTAYHVGEAPDKRAVEIAAKLGIKLLHFAREFTISDFYKFDYILVMDHLNYDAIVAQAIDDHYHNKVFLFRTFDIMANGFYDVPDPYYGGLEDFVEVGEIVTRASHGFIEFLQTEGRLPRQSHSVKR